MVAVHFTNLTHALPIGHIESYIFYKIHPVLTLVMLGLKVLDFSVHFYERLLWFIALRDMGKCISCHRFSMLGSRQLAKIGIIPAGGG